MKKILSLLLAAVMVFSVSGAVIASACTCDYTPIIYVQGAKTILAEKEDGTVYAPVDGDDPMATFSDALGDLVPLLAKAVATDDWDPYCDAVVELFRSTYEPVAPNPDGTLPENSYATPDESCPRDYDSIPTVHGYDSLYVFSDDIRRSPLDIADDLNEFIENVKAKTGHDKVCLISRCAGCCIASAYLYKYQKDIDFAGIDKCIYMQTTSNGVDEPEAVFSGNVKLNPAAAFRWLKNAGNAGSNETSELSGTLTMILNFLYATMGLDAACSLAQQIYNKISYKMFGRIVKMYHARCLTTVASVVDNYEDFKDFIFCEEGDEELFANIIAKADEYHYNVQPAITPMIERMEALGKSVAILADYGDQLSPVCDESEYVADSRTSLYNMSFGATGAKVDGTLSDDYIAGREAAGFGDYISPDKQVDASTCLLPETTWIIKNLHHSFPPAQNALMFRFLREDGFNIHSDPNYPQFLNFTFNWTLVPLQEKNPEDTDWVGMQEEAQETGVPSFIEQVVEWVQLIIDKIKGFLYIILGPLGLMTLDD